MARRNADQTTGWDLSAVGTGAETPSALWDRSGHVSVVGVPPCPCLAEASDHGVNEPRASGSDGDVDERIRHAHDAAQRSGDAGYADPVTGYFVFTRASLLANRRCCGSGCRHCPYDGTVVPKGSND